MIELRLLGSIQLVDHDGNEVRAVLAQPRRLMLLAHLAIRSRHGAERRDSLLGMFWPESDAGHARAALRNAIHFLRHALGAEVVHSRGREELRVGPERLWCDAVVFEELLNEGRREEALELYRGDLLAGFFLTATPLFERWLEAERRRLQCRAAEVATALAEEAVRAGRLHLAAQLMRRSLNLSPTDERAARRLITLLWRTGDRTGSMRAYKEFKDRLAGEFDLGPDHETEGLVAALRAGGSALLTTTETQMSLSNATSEVAPGAGSSISEW